MKLKSSIVFVILFLIFGDLSAQDSDCKIRLPEVINNYSPTIVPVISFDGKYLFFDRKEHPENKGGFKDIDEIWFSELKMGKYWSSPKSLPLPFNTSDSDVLFSLSPDGTKALVYGILPDTSSARKLPGYSLAERQNNEFRNLKPLKISNYYNDSKNYFANLSPDGQILLFSLKRNDCIGGDDIYISFWDAKNDIWSAPKNLSPVINTKNDELSPYLSNDNKTLYFASNGNRGYGDFDLYMTKRLDSSWKSWSTPVNLGKTINSRFKESGFSMTSMSDTAYIVSSEYQLMSSSDPSKIFDTIDLRHGIYKVCIPAKFRPEPYNVVYGKIMHYIGNSKLIYRKKVTFNIFFENKFYSDFTYESNPENGEFLFILPSDAIVKIDEPGYEPISFKINKDQSGKPKFINKNIMLKNDIHTDQPLINLLFEVNKSYLTMENEKKLFDLMLEMNNRQNISFIIKGHADETGTDEYNLGLSLQRAKAVENYLLTIGIEKSKLKIEALGETHPISKDPALNRRVEIFMR